MAEMQLRPIAMTLLSTAVLCISPHTVLADDPPPGTEVVITPGKAAPPSGAGKRTVVLSGPFPQPPPPASAKTSQRTTGKSSTQAASPPPARPAAPAPPPAPPPPPPPRAAVSSPAKARVVPRKRARSHASVHGGRSLRVALPPVARGGPSTIQTQRSDPVAPADPPAVVAPASSAVAVAPSVRATQAGDSLKWVVPVAALAGLLALVALARFAYWRWAIRRSRHHAGKGLDSLPGKPASKNPYAVYRGTRRWGK